MLREVCHGATQEEGEKLGSESLGDPTGAVAQGSPNVLINGLPAARVGDKTTCGAAISQGFGNVLIDGATGSYLDIQSEVPSWVRWAVVVATIAVLASAGAAREIGPMLAETNETGPARALQIAGRAA